MNPIYTLAHYASRMPHQQGLMPEHITTSTLTQLKHHLHRPYGSSRLGCTQYKKIWFTGGIADMVLKHPQFYNP